MYIAITLDPFEALEIDDPDSPGDIIIEYNYIPSATELARAVRDFNCEILEGEEILEDWAFEYTD